jgi:hypothetical protein
MGQGTKNRTERGTQDEGGMKWEGEAPAEPETAASSEWRVANSFFWRAALLHCRKIFCASGDAPSSFSACFSRLRFLRHRLKTGRGTRDEGRNWEGEAPAEPETTASGEWRIAISEW